MIQFYEIPLTINDIDFEAAYSCDGEEIEALALMINGEMNDFSELLDEPTFYQTIYEHNQARLADELGEINRQEDLH